MSLSSFSSDEQPLPLDPRSILIGQGLSDVLYVGERFLPSLSAHVRDEFEERVNGGEADHVRWVVQ